MRLSEPDRRCVEAAACGLSRTTVDGLRRGLHASSLALAIMLATICALAGSAAAQAGASRLPLIGWLRVASPEPNPGEPLVRELAARGLVEGRDYRLEVRLADGDVARMPELARALVAEQPAIIVAFGPDATRAAREATSTVPIIAATAFVEEGLAASLARPPGNLTGVSMLVSEIDPKKLEVLKELLPSAETVGVLNDKSTRIPDRPRSLAAVASELKLSLTTIDVTSPDEFEAAIRAFKEAGTTALLINASTLFATKRLQLGELLARYRLPAVCQWRAMVEAGCLASYGFPLSELFELIAAQVHRVWQGARPDSLPILQPLRFELAINLKVARELGLTIPPLVLQRADEVIE